MNILYLSQYFPPEVGATQTRAHEMARGLVQAGHTVTMLTEVPNHPHGIIPPDYQGQAIFRETLDGIDVVRVWVKTSPAKTFSTRMAFYLSYMGMAIWAGLFSARDQYDVIYATSPPLFVGGAALVLSYLRRIPLIFEVRDLWPESAVALGELNNPRAIQLAEWLEQRCYQRAKRIVVVTEGIRQRLIQRGISPEKLVLIPNGANTDLFQSQQEAGVQLRTKLRLTDCFVVLYAGIHGIAQGLELILDAAHKLQNYPKIRFLFVGNGPVKAELMDQANQLGLQNIIFHEAVDRPDVPAFLSLADIALVPLRKLELFKGALPSKMFDAWACSCPTLTMIDGEARTVLEQANAGQWIPPGDVDALVETIVLLGNEPEQCTEWGMNGRAFVEAHYSRQAQAKMLEQLIVDSS